MRIVFLATGEIAIPAFKNLLHREGCDVVGLVTQPDRPTGRKQILTPPAIKVIAQEHDIPVFQPEKIRTITESLNALNADFFVVMAYGQLLPQKVIDIPRVACLNLHGSLLPKYRGASPIQAAIMAGEHETGVTVMHMIRALDAGDIVLAEKTPIHRNDTGGVLHDRLANVAATAIEKALDAFASGTATRMPQDGALATYLGKLTRVDGMIDWTKSAHDLEKMIRAFDPWPGTTTTLTDNGTTCRLKIFPPTKVVENPSQDSLEAGVVRAVNDALLVCCGDGSALRIETVQPEGKKRMAVADFLRGFDVSENARCN